MSFRLRTDAEKWFGDIESFLDYKFDAYYFCLMAGYAAVRKSKLTSADKPHLSMIFLDHTKRNKTYCLVDLSMQSCVTS